jgi:hypothetical protein
MSLPRLLLPVVLLAFAVNTWAAAPTTAQLNQSRIAGLAWLVTHQSGDGSWKETNGSSIQSTSAGIAALANAGLVLGYPYSAAVTNLQNAEASSVDSLSRQITTLNSAGLNVSPLITKLNQWQNYDSAWGAYKGYGSSLPDTPLALIALLKANATNSGTVTTILCNDLLGAQLADHSFPFLVHAGTSGSPTQQVGALLPTVYSAIALQIVATTVSSSVNCGTTTYALNPLATGSVITAICNLGLEPSNFPVAIAGNFSGLLVGN